MRIFFILIILLFSSNTWAVTASHNWTTASPDCPTCDVSKHNFNDHFFSFDNDENFVTFAQKAILSKTSGTNTGDQIALTTTYNPYSDITSTNVQDAINMLQSLKIRNYASSGIGIKTSGTVTVTNNSLGITSQNISVTGINSVGLGNTINVAGQWSLAAGYGVDSLSLQSVALGIYLRVASIGASAYGVGAAGSGAYLTNTLNNTIVFGSGVVYPILRLSQTSSQPSFLDAPKMLIADSGSGSGVNLLLPASWIMPTGWSGPTGGPYTHSTGTFLGALLQEVSTPLTVGQPYILSYNLGSYISGTLTPGATGTFFSTKTSSQPSMRELFIATAPTTTIKFTPSGNASFAVSNIVLKPATGGDLLVAGNMRSFGSLTTKTLDVMVGGLAGSVVCWKTDTTMGHCDVLTECSTTCL